MEELDAQIDHMVKRFEASAAKWGATVHITHARHYGAYEIATDAPVLQLALKGANNLGMGGELRTTLGGSDANVFNAKGIPCIVLGTGMQAIHTHDEHVSRRDLVDTTRLVYEILVQAARG